MFRKYYCYLFAIFLSFRANAQIDSFNEAVGLGYSCQVAWQLEANGVRTLAYPFDWLHTPFAGLEKFLKKRGKDFFNTDKINNYGPYPGHPAFLHIEDLLYGLHSYHDFYSSPALSNYEVIKEKYDRRIARFFKLLKSNKKVLFIREGSTREEIEQLDALLKQRYPKLSYTILALSDLEEFKEDWRAERIKNFYLHQTPWEWQGDFTKWKEILSQFPIIPNLNRPADERW